MSHSEDERTERMRSAATETPISPVTLAAAVGLATAIIFTAWPQIDIEAAGLFYVGNQQFLLKTTQIGPLLRNGFYLTFLAFGALVLYGLVRTLWLREPTCGVSFPHWLYLASALLIGPGLITNGILKEHWGRPRPVQITEFGGSAQFSPALVPSTGCSSNCSFVSGESSSIFMMMFALALLLPAYRNRLLLAGVGLGLAAGAVRMGMGGHFLSDVIFSGVFMLFVASALHWLLLRRFAHPFAHGGKIHQALASGLHGVSAPIGRAATTVGLGIARLRGRFSQ